jgi:hypothetical protein
VRATNPGGTTYANGSDIAYWSFTTIVAAPGAFNKSAPANAATGVAINTALTWTSSTGATNYEYCIDTTSATTCSTSWVSTGTATTTGALSLTNNTIYYWQVRATNPGGTTYADGSSTSYRSFTTIVAWQSTRLSPGRQAQGQPRMNIATIPPMTMPAARGLRRG